MLEKTLELLSKIKPGTDGPPGEPSFDPAEIDALAGLLGHLVYAPPSLRKRIEQVGHLSITRADFYSQIPTVAELEDSETRPSPRFDYPFRDPEFLVSFLRDLTNYSEPFAPPLDPVSSDSFGWKSDGFSYSDAMAYYAMVKKTVPKTIIELGCGTSTLIAKQALSENGTGRLVCVEPYPSDMLRQLGGIELHTERAQLLTVEFFNDNLSDGDIVFIDTTHTVKHDSDCIHLYLRLLPEIDRDIYVHVHDVHLPEAISVHPQKYSQIFWTEQYLLLAYLMENARTTTLYGSKYHQMTSPGLLEEFMHRRYQSGGASFWFHQKRRAAA